MASAAYFAPAFPVTLAIDSLHFFSPKTIGKRKRSSAVTGDDSIAQETEGPPSDGGLEALSPVAAGPGFLGQDVAIHFDISEHRKGRRLPSSNFLYAHRHRPRNSTQSTVSRRLANLRPPLFVATASGNNAISGVLGLRQQHLLAVTTIVHKCVLEGDFNRAGRAWGMLLRAEQNGQSLDLRSNDRWGLGAEIILRREARLAHIKDELGRTFHRYETSNQHRTQSHWFDLKRFEQARGYYERIVLQYPYRKAFPDTLGPQEFYIAMFSLWIYSVENERIAAQRDILQYQSNRLRTALRENALRRADEIAALLQELIMSPPFSDNHRYLELHGMVESWISDLSEGTHSSSQK